MEITGFHCIWLVLQIVNCISHMFRSPAPLPATLRPGADVQELDAGRVGKVEFPDPNDLTNMVLTVGPDQGLWAGAKFSFTIKVPDMYPHEPPKVMCTTPIYHPNIDTSGHVCLNILRDDWKPVLDINAVIYGLIFLLYEPNPNDPLNHGERAVCAPRDSHDSHSRVPHIASHVTSTSQQLPQQ